jgi:3-oxoacyl-[acyl-carrier protein] reductase
MSELIKTQAPQDSGVPAHARDFSVEGRVVIVTGSGQGIGREYVRQFTAAGAIAVVADLDVSKAKSVLGEIEAVGGRGMAIGVDVSDERSVQSMVDAVLSAYGRIDVLINNASIFATLDKKLFVDIPLEEWERVMRVNVTGSFICSKAVVPAMRKAGWGRIIHISSSAVPHGVPNYLHYVTSKAAVVGMTNAMSRELGADGITVNAIRPGGRNRSQPNLQSDGRDTQSHPEQAMYSSWNDAGRHGWHRTLSPRRPSRIHHRPDHCL